MRIIGWIEPGGSTIEQLTQHVIRMQCLDDTTGQPVDAAGLAQLTVQPPGAAQAVYGLSGVPAPNVVKDGTGAYHWPWVPNKAGKWQFLWQAATAGTADQGVCNLMAYTYAAITG